MNSKQVDSKRAQVRVWVRKQLGKAWDGVIGNAVWAFVVLVFGLIAALALVIKSWGLEVAIPILRDFLSTKVVVTVGSITATVFPILILAIILIFFNRKRWLKADTHAQEREVKIVEQDQRLAELQGQLTKNEKLIKQLHEQQEANSKSQNELMREKDELYQNLQDKNSLISNREYLILKYGLYIISATYGVHGKKTENVTETVILYLAEKGEIPIDNDVFLRGVDFAYGQPKKLKVDYVYGEKFSMAIPEVAQRLRIKDLIQNAEDNKPKDFLNNSGLTQKS